ncbi:MAG: hypothetical protein ABIY55_10450 [Kofleriaceae bacterium]
MHARRLVVGSCIAVALAACASSDDYVIVTVAARAAVHGATALTVTLANAGTTRMDTLALTGAFPLTFSISSPGRTGDLAITLDATDASGLVVGHGTGVTQIGAAEALVVIESTDFVVNTDFAGNQFTSNDFEASGLQLAALPDGTWTAAFRDDCQGSDCNLFARRFDADGVALQSAVAVSSNAFGLTSKTTSNASTPALAAGATTTLAVWDFFDGGGATTSGVACRALDAAGNAGTAQLAVAADAADVVAIAALGSGNFVASWSTSTGGVQGIHAVRIKPDCTPLGAVVAISAMSDSFIHRAAVASSGTSILFTWIVDGDLHARVMSNAGVLMGADSVLVPKTTTDQILHARIAPVSTGFLIAARWAQLAGDGPGRIEIIQVDTAGVRVGDPILVTDRSSSDSDSSESFGFASRDDRAMVVWHACGALGDDSGCGVFGRFLHATGAPVGDSFGLATTTLGDQTRPSVAALPDGFVATWTDASQKSPDTAGQSVRARIFDNPLGF